MKRLSILHLEDDLLDAELVEQTLLDAGFVCTCERVDNRLDFQRQLESGHFGLILADYSLPAFDGVTALSMAQQMRPEVPFIFLSGALGEERAIETLKNGATDYVLKHSLDRLTSSISRALRESQARTERERARESLLFLAGSGVTLGTSLDFETTVADLSRLAVPFLADLCIVSVLHPEREAPFVTFSHRESAAETLVRDFLAKRPLEAIIDSARPGFELDKPILIEKISAEVLNDAAPEGEQRAILRHLELHSALVLPLEARGRSLGLLAFFSVDAADKRGRRYDEHDLTLAKNLANRAALAIDNARLYYETQTALRARDEFLATLSHELRTPLNAILGWTQLLRSGGLDEETSAQALEVIERNTKTQAQLIEDLLEVSRVITGKLRLEVRPVQMSSVISEALESVRLAAESKGIAIEYSFSECAVSGDAHRLQQVVWNLLSNAIKFTPKGGQVAVSLARADSYACLSVRDTGLGIAPDFLPHVFERFRQADSSSTRSVGGLGLGLGIVRHLVELHGGSVTAHSDGEGSGAVFTVMLPLLAVQVAPEFDLETLAFSPADSTASEKNKGRLKNVRVLVVDDQTDAQRLVSAVLESCGALVTCVSTAREALSHIENNNFDLLVSDIGMPGEDGYWLIRHLRALGDDRRHLPAMALTAYARESDRAEALRCEFQAHGVKPIEPAHLIELVANLAGRD